jgi:hypothetical protein
MSLPPTVRNEYRSWFGLGRKTGDSQFHPRFLSASIFFYGFGIDTFPIGALFSLKIINWRLLYGFGPFTVTARDALSE